MNSSEGRIYIGVGIDTDSLASDVRKVNSALRGVGEAAVREGEVVDRAFRRIGTTVGGVFSVKMALDFASKVAMVRGEFQKLEVAFSVMLRSQEKGSRLMSEMAELAAKTPFGLTEVSQEAKQLLAYGSAVEDVKKELVMLGDIAAGLSMPLGDLVYLYGTTRTQGRMYTMDLRQFMGRGIPLAEELAKQFGVTKDKVGELVTAGRVGFEEMRKALVAMTSEGGRFAGLMDMQSRTISGQISNIEDAFQQMVNEIGKKSEGFINKSLQGVSWLVENYEKVGRAVGTAVIAIGSYKTALVTISAIEKMNAARKAILVAAFRRAAAANDQLTASMYRQYIAGNKLSLSLKGLGAGVKAAASPVVGALANPYVIAASAVAGLTVFLYNYLKVSDMAKKASEDHAKAVEKLADGIGEEKAKADRLISTIQDESASRVEHYKALEDLKSSYPELFKKYIDEKGHISDLIALQRGLNEERAAKKISGDYDALAEYRRKLSDYKILQEANDKGISLANAGTFNSVRSLMEGKAWNKSIKSYIKEQVRYWSYMVTAQESVVSANVESGFKARLKAMSDGELASLKAAYDERAEKFGELTKKEKASLDKIEAELESRKGLKVVRDKKYWDDLKKSAQSELEALDEIEAKGKKGAEIKKRIAEYQSRIDSFSASKTKSSESGGKTVRDIARKEESLAEELRDIDRQIASDRISIVDETNDTIFDRNKRDFERKLIQIEEYKDKLLAKETEIARAKHMAAYGGSDKGFKKPESLSQESQSRIDYLTAEAVNERAQKDLSALNAIVRSYQDYGERRKAIEKKYNDDIKAMRDGFFSGTLTDLEATSSAIVQAEKDKNAALYELDREYLGQFALIFAEASSLPKNLLSEAVRMTELEIERARKSGNVEALAELYRQLNAQLKASSESEWGFGAVSSGFKSLKKAAEMFKLAESQSGQEKAGTLQQASYSQTEGLSAIKKGAGEVASAFSKLGQSLSSFEGGIGRVGEVMRELGAMSGGFVSAFADFKATGNKGGLISMAIESVSKAIDSVSGSIRKAKEEQERWNAAVEQAEHRYKILKLEALSYKDASIFGVENPYQKAIDSARLYGEALKEINSMSDAMGGSKVEVGSYYAYGNNFSAGAGTAAGAAAGAAAGSVVPVIGTAVGAVLGAAIGGLVGLFSGRERVAVFRSLKDEYGDIYNKETFELNPRILADYDKLDEKTRRIVDNWEEIRKKASEARNQMQDTFKQLAGDVGEDLSDSLVAAFRSGKLNSAIDDFHGKMTGTIEDIVQRLVFSSVFKDLFNDLEKRMGGSFEAGGDNSIVDDLQWFDEVYRRRLGLYENAMKNAKDQLGKQGYKAWEGVPRTGAAGGIQSVTQDSVNELNGRATAIQGHTYSISENTKILVENTGRILKSVVSIDANTGYVASRMSVIEDDLRGVKNTINNIALKGLAIRR